ncbi:hypothetical protein Hanom_Chr05g00417971 [Helianthus anomalus]
MMITLASCALAGLSDVEASSSRAFSLFEVVLKIARAEPSFGFNSQAELELHKNMTNEPVDKDK